MLDGIHLTLLIGPVVAVPVPRELTDALVSAQVTTSAGQRSGFQLVFAFGKGSLIADAMLPVGFFDPGIRVILMVTINSIPSVLMDGIITRQEVAPSNDPGQSRLTVTGEDVSVMMDLIDFTGFPFPAMPPEVRVALLVAKYAIFGLVPIVIPSLFVDVPIPTNEIPSQQGNDLQYIQKLADDAGYVFYVEPGPAPGVNFAYWGPEIRVGVPQPALNVNFDAATNVESFSFSQDGLARETPVIWVHEPLSHLNIPVPVPSVSLLKPPLSARPALALKVKQLQTSHLPPLRAALQGLAHASGSSDAVSGSGTLNVLRYGRVLKARQLVGVRGASPAGDGLYYVKSVTHNLKAGEYKQSFTLAREGLVSLLPNVPA
jgi:hypothetical protein